jgi:hypothetical protein
MEYHYSRINLSKTNYSLLDKDKVTVLKNWSFEELNDIYVRYCRHKKFKSVMPIFLEDYKDNEILGYYDDNGQLVAWSMMLLYPSQLSVVADQFAWNYHNPKLRLGIVSLEHECAYYKSLGYKYLYLQRADQYKKNFAGFEILGPA